MNATVTLHGVQMLAAASAIAGTAHSGQLDALGAPYLGHVNRVTAYAEQFRVRYAPGLDRFAVATVATLHDVVEDTALSVDDLRAHGFPEGVLQSVVLLTHSPHTPRAEYLEAIARVPLARVVKLADTWDNADPVRLRAVAAADPDRAQRLAHKYDRAWTALGGAGTLSLRP